MKDGRKIKAVFVDLDGTLLQGVDTISERNIQTFQKLKEKGIVSVIATGRPTCEARFAIDAIGADTFLIVMNGLMVYENYKEKKLLFESYMPDQTAKEIISFLMEQHVFFEVYIGEQSYCSEESMELLPSCGMGAEYIDFFRNVIKTIQNPMELLLNPLSHINKIFISVAEKEKRKVIRQRLDAMEGVNTFSSGETYLEILPQGADKRKAVCMVREMLHLKQEEIMVIGDSENDMGMFNAAGICVAVGNAYPELKNKADVIAPSNEEDGVAWALEHFVLGES